MKPKADEAFHQGDLALGDYGLEVAYSLGDAAIALAPLAAALLAPQALLLVGGLSAISVAKDFYEAYYGESLLSGEKLSDVERSLAGLSVALVIPGSKQFVKSVGAIKDGADLLAKWALKPWTDSFAKTFRSSIDEYIRFGIDNSQSMRNFKSTHDYFKAKGISKSASELMFDLRHWGIHNKYNAFTHLVIGEFHNKLIAGGIHTFSALKGAFNRIPGLEAGTKIETLSNGVIRATIDGEFITKGHLNKMVDNPGGKTLFPESWTDQKILDSVNSIVDGATLTFGPQTIEKIVDNVNIRVILFDGKITTAFPTWIQP